MRKVFISILILLGCIIQLQALAQSSFEEKKYNSYSTRIIHSSQKEYYAEVEVQHLSLATITRDNCKFQTIDIDGWGVFSNVGEPALPKFRQCIAIPEGYDIISDFSLEELQWDTLSITDRIFPFQEPLTERQSPKQIVLNETIYKQESYCPYLIHCEKQNVYRNIPNHFISVSPFIYYPTLHKLAVLKKFRVKISFGNSGKDLQPRKNISNATTLFSNITASNQHILRNDRECLSSYSSSNSDTYDYLILVGKLEGIENSNLIHTFCEWKTSKGLRTKCIYLPSYINLGGSVGIKRIIQQEYDLHNIRYVLLIGDSQYIPTMLKEHTLPSSNIEIIPSDYLYGCMDGDNDIQADIAIGRFPVNNLSELSNIINKTIRYEKGDGASGNDVVLMAHQQQNPSFQDSCEVIRNDSIINSIFNIHTAYGASPAAGGDGATSSDIINFIQNGIGILSYRGHGAPTLWDPYWCAAADFPIDVNQVSLLTNTLYPVIFSLACQTGYFINETCLMEAFINNNTGGAVAGLGATVETYHSTNNSYNHFLFNYLATTPSPTIGDANLLAHFSTLRRHSSLGRRGVYSYVCFGDPALEIWTGHISEYPDIDIDILDSLLRFEIRNIGEYDIYLTWNNEILSQAHSSSGVCLIERPTIPFYDISICKQNYKPHHIEVYTSASDHTLSFNTHTINVASPAKLGSLATEPSGLGNVVIRRGATLQLNKKNGVELSGGFECELGGTLIIK